MQVLRERPRWPTARRYVAAAFWLVGRAAEARAAAEFLRSAPAAARVPSDHLRRVFVDRAFAEALIGALRGAGLPG